MKKILLATASLSVITAAALTMTEVRSAAVEEKQGAACSALTQEVQDGATTLGGLLGKQQPIDLIVGLVNGLSGKAWSLVRLGCLPEPAFGQGTSVPANKQLPPLPTPTVTALPPIGLPTVSICVDLGADLMSTIWAVKAALLSTTAPDLAAALDAVNKLLDTLTGLTDPTNKCLPAPAPA